MTTIIEDIELDTELQELYIKSRHWISDLDFFDQDLQFFRKLFGHEKRQDFTDITAAIIEIQNHCHEIKEKVVAYLHSLEPLISKADQSYDISIIEKHVLLEFELASLLHSFKAIKTKGVELGLGYMGPAKNHLFV